MIDHYFIRSLRLRASALMLAALLSLLPQRATAETSAENKAAAREFAREGIALAGEGKCDEALTKLQRAERLYHAPSILAWIGICQVRTGKLVEGTETLNHVVREELSPDAPAAFVSAQKDAAALLEQTRPQIAKLVIHVSANGQPVNDHNELRITVDDAPIASALVGAPRPTDPGEHTVSVAMPGYESQTEQVNLEPGEKKSLELSLTELSSNIEETAAGDPTSAPPQASSQGRRSPAAGWTLVGIGAGSLAGGAVTGILALNKKNQLACPVRSDCPPKQGATLNSARRYATLSTVLFAVGGGAATVGVVLLATGKKRSKERTPPTTAQLNFGPGWGLASLKGSF